MSHARHPARRRALGTLACAVVAATGLADFSASSQADVIECAGIQSDTYSPGLTLTAARTTVTSDYLLGPCIAPSDPDVRAGSARESYTRDFSCVFPLTPLPQRSYTITWNTGRTSVYTFQQGITAVLGRSVSTYNGQITSGAFRGTTVAGTSVMISNPLNCTTASGVTIANGTTTFTGV
jgi:hypothetical protein